jgi:hypothetical protein
MVTDKGLAPEVADKIGEFVLQSGPPKDLWKILTDKATFGDHVGASSGELIVRYVLMTADM